MKCVHFSCLHCVNKIYWNQNTRSHKEWGRRGGVRKGHAGNMRKWSRNVKKTWRMISRAETLSAGAVVVWKRTNSKVTVNILHRTPILRICCLSYKKECGYVLVGQKKRNLAIPLNLSICICLQCASRTIEIPLKMPEFRSHHLCPAWLNYLLILFLPDLQTSEGPFIEEISSLRTVNPGEEHRKWEGGSDKDV